MHELAAEGWYLDPYGVHEQRWMSDGRPTSLVRDAAVVAEDEPPQRPPPEPFVPAPVVEGTLGTGLRRADDADKGPSPDLGSYVDVAFDANARLNNRIMAGVISSGPRGGMMFETPFERKLRQQARRAKWARRWRKLFGESPKKQ